jgi:transposase
MAEFGVTAAIGRGGLDRLIAVITDQEDTRLPDEARACLAVLCMQLEMVKEQILDNDRRILADARRTEAGRRLMKIPGIGPLLASAIVACVPDPATFSNARSLSAWIGLTPRQNSSGGKERLGSITKAGNTYLRELLVVGAMAVVRQAKQGSPKWPWVTQLLERKKPKVAAVALANKNARIIWAMMATGEPYREPELAAA